MCRPAPSAGRGWGGRPRRANERHGVARLAAIAARQWQHTVAGLVTPRVQCIGAGAAGGACERRRPGGELQQKLEPEITGLTADAAPTSSGPPPPVAQMPLPVGAAAAAPAQALLPPGPGTSSCRYP